MINFLRKINWIRRNFKYLNPYSRISNVPESSKVVHIHFTPSHGNTISYNSDGMLLWNNSDCLESDKFKKAYLNSLIVNDWRGIDGKDMDMRWRYYMICSFAERVSTLEGDFVECGVYKGGYSKAIIDYIGFNHLGKTFYLLDTYEGLVEEFANENEINSGLVQTYSNYKNTYQDVLDLFKNDNVQIIKGRVPDTLVLCNTNKICFLSIDMNMVMPEIEAAQFFWDKLVSGGIIVLDDYGFFAHKEQRAAFDQFATEKGVCIISLPTGQALIFKP